MLRTTQFHNNFSYLHELLISRKELHQCDPIIFNIYASLLHPPNKTDLSHAIQVMFTMTSQSAKYLFLFGHPLYKRYKTIDHR